MGPTESNVLNYHRADLIRRIAIKWVIEAERGAPDGILTIDKMDEIAGKIKELDNKYILAPKTPPRDSQYIKELELVAFGILRREGRADPLDLKRLREIMDQREVREKARALLVSNLYATEIDITTL